MAWSTTEPTLPNGASWNTAKTASRTWNWYKISIEVQTARGKGSTFYVKMKVSFANGENGYNRSADGLWWYVGGIGNSANYNMSASAGSSQTRYWTGTESSDSTVSKNIGVSIKESTSSTYTVKVSINVAGRIYYTITYNANGGSGTQQTRDILSGSAATLINNPYTYTGHTFNKWNTNSGGTGTAYSEGASYTPTKNVTLYAIWNIITYNITYNGNGNTGGSTASQTRDYGAAAISIRSNGFTRTGYTFVHWNTKADDSGTTYTPGQSYSTNANLALYAIWQIITYTISYNGNNNTGGSTASQTRNYDGAAILIRENGFVKSGYTFDHWNTASDDSGTTYLPQASYSTNANLTLYAIWVVGGLPIYVNIGDTIYQVETVYINDNGTIKVCNVYANVDGTIKEFF